MLWVYLLCIIALMIAHCMEDFNPLKSKFAKEALIRIEKYEDDRRSLILAEEERIVQFLLDPEDNIVDCMAARRKYHLLESLISEVEIYEETGHLGENVTYVEQKVDVGWYGRRCRKTKRDQLRDIELGESDLPEDLALEIAETHWVELGLPGTNFCSRKTPAWAFLETNIGVGEEETPVDTCCMNLWSCDPSPSHPLLPLSWAQGRFNSHSWPVWSCSCLGRFLTCLTNTRTQLGPGPLSSRNIFT